MSTALAEAHTGVDEHEDEQPLRLFEVKPDPAPPTLITVNINGTIRLDLSKKSDVDFYNSLQAGKNVTYETEFFVASTKKTHRRDNEGNVQATPESKSLVVDLVHYDGADDPVT